MTSPVFHARPEPAGGLIEVAPAVASWDKAGTPGRLRSSAFMDGVREAVGDQMSVLPDPLAFRLDIGLPGSVGLLRFHDLDNFLLPLVPRLTQRRFASVWATKSYRTSSSAIVSPAREIPDPGGSLSFEVRTTTSSEKSSYKEEIRDRIREAQPLPDGGVALQLAFVVGPSRSWPNLWKPTIDSLGSILGHDAGAGEWNPRDGRITDLGLHCVVDPTIGHRVVIAIRAGTAATPLR